jgi:Flp pilus assembly protein TadB
MEASYFYSIVLPLGVFVFLLTALAYYYARKEEQARRNWEKLMNEHTKKQLERKEDTRTNDYHAMKLEKALEQLNVATDVNKLGEEEEDMIETCCSEEDASYNVT